jgi:hypothetical protein
MTTAAMALTELAEKGADIDVLRQMVQFMAQRLMELDVEGRCGAGYDEKTAERLNSRNGYRDRSWDTRVGSVELKIPKLRQGSYFPEFLEPRRTAEKALTAVIQEAAIKPVSLGAPGPAVHFDDFGMRRITGNAAFAAAAASPMRPLSPRTPICIDRVSTRSKSEAGRSRCDSSSSASLCAASSWRPSSHRRSQATPARRRGQLCTDVRPAGLHLSKPVPCSNNRSHLFHHRTRDRRRWKAGSSRPARNLCHLVQRPARARPADPVGRELRHRRQDLLHLQRAG